MVLPSWSTETTVTSEVQEYVAVKVTAALVAVNGRGSVVTPSDHLLKVQLP